MMRMAKSRKRLTDAAILASAGATDIVFTQVVFNRPPLEVWKSNSRLKVLQLKLEEKK